MSFHCIIWSRKQWIFHRIIISRYIHVQQYISLSTMYSTIVYFHSALMKIYTSEWIHFESIAFAMLFSHQLLQLVHCDSVNGWCMLYRLLATYIAHSKNDYPTGSPLTSIFIKTQPRTIISVFLDRCLSLLLNATHEYINFKIKQI